jgi:hypothetical protein
MRFTASTFFFIPSYRNSSSSFFFIFMYFHNPSPSLFKSPFFFCFYCMWINDAATFFLVPFFSLSTSLPVFFLLLINQSVSKFVYVFCIFSGFILFVIHSLRFSCCFCLNMFSLLSDLTLFSHLQVTFPPSFLIGSPPSKS